MTQQTTKRKVSKHEFYFETPLYTFVKLNELESDIFEGDVDAYNSVDGFDTTYQVESERIGDYQSHDYYNFYTVTLTCKRKAKSKLRFFLYFNKEIVVKLGQFPSLADIQYAKIAKKYDKFLSKQALKEFKRAIGLAANGVGIGSFVYLRRIFEDLIREAYQQNKSLVKINEKDFLEKRMEEKIKTLKAFLPSQLVEMKSIYKILSKGVHKLSEQECLTYFPALKLSIELILEQKIEEEVKRKRDEEVKKQLAIISQEIHETK